MRTLVLVSACLIALLVGPSAHAEVKMSDATKKATAKALAWLKEKQNADGSWSDGSYIHNTAITSFALLAFLSQGHLPNQGHYGPEVAKGARFLMAAAQPRKNVVDGKEKETVYIIGARGIGRGNMYCHGMATLALSELWGSTGDDEIKPILQKAADLIVGSQNPEGGWRYEPNPSGADISVTIMQVMALRGCRNAGIHVPDQTMKNAIKYIEKCYRKESGGFTYMPKSGAPGFARTAAGTCILLYTANYADLPIPKEQLKDKEKLPRQFLDLRFPGAIAYLNQHFDDRHHFYYGHYYAAHTMHQLGGKDWENWYGRVEKTFLPRQTADGYFTSDGTSVGPVYATSIATIILSVPANYLPIFQR
jgi:Prenyltransferase and squalene oxidase repeat